MQILDVGISFQISWFCMARLVGGCDLRKTVSMTNWANCSTGILRAKPPCRRKPMWPVKNIWYRCCAREVHARSSGVSRAIRVANVVGTEDHVRRKTDKKWDIFPGEKFPSHFETFDKPLQQESRRHSERPHTFWDTQPVPSMSSELLGKMVSVLMRLS